MKVKFGVWANFADDLLLFVYNKARKNLNAASFMSSVEPLEDGCGGETSLLGTGGRKGDVILR